MPHPTEWEPVIRGRLQTLLASNGAEADFAILLVEASNLLGKDSSVTLLTEAVAEQLRSYRRPVEESVTAWDRLRCRAQGCLAADDRTLMMIRSHHLRFLRLCGRPADLDMVIMRRRDEVDERAERWGSDDNYAGIARADLAVALIDRVRTFARCAVPTLRADDDLAEAQDLTDGEISRRARLYTPGNSMLQGAKLIMAELLVAMAESTGSRGQDFARKSLTMTPELVDYFWEQNGTGSSEVLRSLVAQAEALSLCGSHQEAARMARQAWRISPYSTRSIDRGRPAFALAVTLLPTDREAATTAAAWALSAREDLFPADSCRIIEVRRFLQMA